MKIKVKSLIFFPILFVIFFAFNNWFYIIDFGIDRVNVMIISSVLGIIAFGSYTELTKKKPENLFICIFFLLVLFEAFYSTIRYSQSFIDSLMADKFYLVILLYFVLVTVCKTETEKDNLENIFIFFGLVVSILIDYQVLVLYPSGQEMLTTLEYWKRGDGIRVTASSHFIEFSMLIAFSKLLSIKRDNKKHIINKWNLVYLLMTIFGMINLLSVSKTRMSILIVFSIIGLMIIFKEKITQKKQFVFRFIILLAVIILAYYYLNFSFISSMFDDSDYNAISYSTRVEEANLYISHLLSNPVNFFFGMGMIHDSNTGFYYSILGANGAGGRTDVGILGFAHEFGFIGLMLYIWIIVRGFKIIRLCRNHNKNCMDLMALWLYFILGSSTLCMFNRGRIIAIPLLLYLYHFYSENNLDRVIK